MVLRVITIATLVAAGHTVAAQTPVQAQIAPEAKHQVSLFENSLRVAIEKAGSDMQRRAIEVVPDVSLKFESEIRVYSLIQPEGDIFLVDVPAILARSLEMFNFMLRTAPNPNPRMSNSTGPEPAPGTMMNPDRDTPSSLVRPSSTRCSTTASRYRSRKASA